VGAGHAHHRHEPGPLARDALDHAGPRRPQAWPSCCPTRPSGSPIAARDGANLRPCDRRHRPRPARWPGARRRRRRRGHRRRRRVDDLRRVAPGDEGARRPGRGRDGGGRRQPARAVDAVGEDTALSGIMRLVAQAQASNSRAQALADRAAAVLFYVALVAGVLTLGAWTLLGDPEEGLIRTATVLVIACPHALGLAIPLVIAISTTLGARNGLLVKDRLALERAQGPRVVIFDKTGHADPRRARAVRRRGRTGDRRGRAPGPRGGRRGRLASIRWRVRSWPGAERDAASRRTGDRLREPAPDAARAPRSTGPLSMSAGRACSRSWASSRPRRWRP
jgi:hypothetical protein